MISRLLITAILIAGLAAAEELHVEPGETVEITCSAPPPMTKLRIEKEDGNYFSLPLNSYQDKTKYSASESEGRYHFIVKDVRVEDGGTYKCIHEVWEEDRLLEIYTIIVDGKSRPTTKAVRLHSTSTEKEKVTALKMTTDHTHRPHNSASGRPIPRSSSVVMALSLALCIVFKRVE